MLVITFGILLLASAAFASPVDFQGGRVVGGHDVDIKDYPYQASVMSSNSHVCGGAIISSRHIITAAHCVYNLTTTTINVRIGANLRNTGGVILPMEKLYVHPNFDSKTIDYDIAILYLKEQIIFDIGMLPIGLTEKNISSDIEATLSGWGAINEDGSTVLQLQGTQMPFITTEECRTYYGNAVTNRMVCAGLKEGGKDACYGDSGSPLVVEGLLVGIVSWGQGCARPNSPGVYASIVSLRDFITEITDI